MFEKQNKISGREIFSANKFFFKKRCFYFTIKNKTYFLKNLEIFLDFITLAVL